MQNSIKTSPVLRELSGYFSQPLYLVGGYVRDSLSGYEPKDVDITSSFTPEEVFACLDGTKFRVCVNSPKLMTLKISYGAESYEYTSFRVDTYTKGHSPIAVERTDDIVLDAGRRDFTVNAIYYDIKNGVIVNPVNGLEDLAKKRLVAVNDPIKVFGEDGLRLMRLARFYGELGFSVEAKTFESAKENRNLIKDIAPERIRDELDKILIADTRYGNADGQTEGLELLRKLGVLEIILPELTAGYRMAQRADFHKYDVYYHILATVKHADPRIRLSALLHDIAKPYCYLKTGRFHTHEIEGARIAKEIMTRLRYSKREISKVMRLTKAHMYDLNCEAKEETLRVFILRNIDVFDDLLLLKQADYLGGGIFSGESRGVTRLKECYAKMISQGAPFSVKELKIDGNDLIEYGVLPDKRSDCLIALNEFCVKNPNNNTREKQLEFIKKYK